MNEPSDAAILASARRALADAAPAEPSPALLAAVRREAARRARALRLRRALLLAAAAAAAVVIAFAHPVFDARTGHGRPPTAGAAPAVAGTPSGAADSAVRLLLLDAAETRAAADLAADSDGEGEAAVASAAEDDPDWSSLSFSDALLAWQEAPLADFADTTSAVF